MWFSYDEIAAFNLKCLTIKNNLKLFKIYNLNEKLSNIH